PDPRAARRLARAGLPRRDADDARAPPLLAPRGAAAAALLRAARGGRDDRLLNEARSDLLQGVDVPPEEGGAFRRYACKMATGAGKTTVMAMVSLEHPEQGRRSGRRALLGRRPGRLPER